MELPIEYALSQIEIFEFVGKLHNKEVVKYFKETGHEAIIDDETAWCAAFVNWCLMKAGKEYSKQLNARSYITIGVEVKEPEVGDIVVLKRGTSSWQGHVGFYCREDNRYIYVLGGNQGNKVCAKPYKKEDLLSYRRI